MHHMTWEEVQKYVERRALILVLVGSVEEHSLHLPLIIDSLIAEELAKILL